MYWVYIHTNLTNGKVYIGTTQKERPARRWGVAGAGYQSNNHFWNAIQKYGWDGFSHEFWEVDSAEEMWAQEVSLIALYDATNPDKGYNHSTGGESGSKGYKWTDEQRNIFRDILADPEYKARVSKSLKEVWLDPEYKACVSKSLKEVWSDPNLRAYMSKVQKEVWLDPEYRAYMSNIFREVWSDPNLRAYMSKVQKEVWMRPGYREHQSELQKKAWSTSDLREHQSENITNLWRDSKYRQMQSESRKRALESPERRRKMSEAKKGKKWLGMPNRRRLYYKVYCVLSYQAYDL